MKLSKAQKEVIYQMQNGAVIGELSEKINGHYELFTRKPTWVPETNHQCEHPFKIRWLSKNTVFALLTLGLICEDNSVASSMLPFSRNVWYVYKEIISERQNVR